MPGERKPADQGRLASASISTEQEHVGRVVGCEALGLVVWVWPPASFPADFGRQQPVDFLKLCRGELGEGLTDVHWMGGNRLSGIFHILGTDS